MLLGDNLSYEEDPIAILDKDVQNLITKEISSMRVQGRNRPVKKATPKTEANMHKRYLAIVH